MSFREHVSYVIVFANTTLEKRSITKRTITTENAASKLKNAVIMKNNQHRILHLMPEAIQKIVVCISRKKS